MPDDQSNEHVRDVTNAKAALRERMKAVRAVASADAREAAAASVAASLPALFDRPPAVVSTYWAIGEEFNPGPLEAALRSRGHTIALPVMTGRTAPLTFRAWRPGDALVERAWGIREPRADATVVLPDVVLLPLLAFDGAGFRLGYGGGYYDRTLATLRRMKPVVAVGVGFAEQRVDVVPHLDYDQRLDFVLTPAGLEPFG